MLIFSLYDNTWLVIVKEIAVQTHFELRFPVVSQLGDKSTSFISLDALSCERSTYNRENRVVDTGGVAAYLNLSRNFSLIVIKLG